MADWLNNDRELLARTLTAEAGNQGVPGLLAAGSVIMNRVKQGGYGDGVRGVILKPGQFSPLNSLTGYAGGEQGQDMAAIRPTSEAYSVADALLSGDYTDPTGGATHFYNPDISSPSWGGGEGWTRIGAHVFGKADAGRSGGMAPQQRPTGPTMSSMGSARMAQQSAPQDPRQPFYKNTDFWDRAALAFGGLSMHPNQALMQMSADRIQQSQEARKTTQQRNRTAEWLRSQGRADLADAVLSGTLDGQSAAALAYQKPKGVVVGDRIVDPQTGKVIYEDASAPGYEPKDVSAARKEFTALPQVKDFAQQTSAYGRILASAEEPSAAGDLALIFNYMKILDPNSSVQQGEFANAQNAGGVDQRVASLYNNLITGQRLTPEQRADFADRATRLYADAEQQYSSVADQYSQFAAAAGLPVEQVIPDFAYSGQRYETPLEFRRPPTPAGRTEDEWATAWSNMTDAERQEYLNQGQ